MYLQLKIWNYLMEHLNEFKGKMLNVGWKEKCQKEIRKWCKCECLSSSSIRIEGIANCSEQKIDQPTICKHLMAQN